MRLTAFLVILCVAGCTESATVGTGNSPSEESGFLRCPDKPGKFYRPGFEKTTCEG